MITNPPEALRRRIPNPQDLLPLMRLELPTTHLTQRRLAKAQDTWDLRDLAKKRTPKAPFEYVDGAAETEISLSRSRRAFRDIEFQPGVMRDVSSVSTKVTVGDRELAMPLGIAPTGFTRMMHTEGEYAGSRAAAEKNILFCLSTMGTASPEQVAAYAPDGLRWFQLYLWKDREKSKALVQRAKEAGFETLVITVDTAVAGARHRDPRNGFSIPPALTPATVFNAALKPRWWFDFLTTEPLTFASLSDSSEAVADIVHSMFDPSLNFDDLEWIREQWDGPMICKGIQTVQDAIDVVKHGADGVIISNHGGRQLDRAPVPLYLVPKVREALGKDRFVGLDTGVMSGADMVAAKALGADLVLIGRAYMYGLMAGGYAGVSRLLDIFQAEATRTLQLMGISDINDLTPEHVNLHTEMPAPGRWL